MTGDLGTILPFVTKQRINLCEPDTIRAHWICCFTKSKLSEVFGVGLVQTREHKLRLIPTITEQSIAQKEMPNVVNAPSL